MRPTSPAAADTGPKPNAAQGHEVVIGGWTHDRRQIPLAPRRRPSRRASRLCRPGRHRLRPRPRSQRLLPTLRALETEVSPFTGIGAPAKARGVHWLKPELVAEIEFAGWTGDGLVRQAAFKGLREDKPAAEVEAETPAPAAQRPKFPQPAVPSSSKPSTRRQSRVSWASLISQPGQGALAGRRRRQAGHQAGPRPLLRGGRRVDDRSYSRAARARSSAAPDGIGGEQFLPAPRHAGHVAACCTVVTVSGDRKPYLQIDRVEASLPSPRSARVELHPWNCEPQQPEVPGRLVFDLDPGPDVPFDDGGRSGAGNARRLDALGLVSFCKTTGGKGLHVVTPLDDRQEASSTGRTPRPSRTTSVCRWRADSPGPLPDQHGQEQERNGRIFLDYLRNDRMATAVAPLSPRARPGATVSMPLSWSQVRSRSRSQALHDPHRAGSAGKERGLEGLLRRSAPARAGDQTAGQDERGGLIGRRARPYRRRGIVLELAQPL